MFKLHRISQNVLSFCLLFIFESDFSFGKTASRKLRQVALGARHVYPQRGLATAAEQYDVVVIGGGMSAIFVLIYFSSNISCVCKVPEDTWQQLKLRKWV